MMSWIREPFSFTDGEVQQLSDTNLLCRQGLRDSSELSLSARKTGPMRAMLGGYCRRLAQEASYYQGS